MYFESPKSGSIPTKLSTQNWQTAGVALPLIDVGFGKGALYNEIVGPRYAFSFSGTPAAYFINDAKVERADVDATNGMIQIMDKVVNYPYESMGFFQYLSQAQDLTKMLTLWNKLRITGTPLYTQLTNQIYMGKTLYATYFVVPDSVWNQLPPKTYQDLLDNETLMIKVLANHYAPNQLFYPRWVRGSSGRAINFYVGFPNDPLPEAVNTQSLTPGKMAGSVDNSALTITVQNSYAETVGLAVVLRNAVLIPVSAPLGYLSETTQDALARLSPTFLRVCTLDTACNAILQSTTEKTVFAPVDWTQFNTLSSANQSEYLKLMIVPERILRPQMTTDKYVTVGSIPDAIRFRTRNSVLNVEARTPGNGYVPVALADSESSGSDGVVYLVTGVPGLPTQTVRNFLGGDSAFRNYVNTGILDHQIRGGPYTFFAADNGALDAMRADANLGAKIYESVERRIYVLRRSVFPMQLLLNELNTSVMYDVATANNAFTLEYVRFVMQVEGGLNTATVNGTVTVSMTDGGYQCTDGWVYHVNKMFYVADDLTRSLCTMPACPKTN
nr:fasciclin 1 [Echinococcus granulosus]